MIRDAKGSLSFGWTIYIDDIFPVRDNKLHPSVGTRRPRQVGFIGGQRCDFMEKIIIRVDLEVDQTCRVRNEIRLCFRNPTRHGASSSVDSIGSCIA
jgi:hypothetical protein